LPHYHTHSPSAATPPAGVRRPTPALLPRIEAMAAQVSDLGQRLDQAIAAWNAADQDNRAILDALQQGAATAQQHAEQINQNIASSQAANQQLHHEFAAAKHRTEAQLAEIELRLLRA